MAAAAGGGAGGGGGGLPQPPEPCLLDQLGALMDLAGGSGGTGSGEAAAPPPLACTALLTQIGALLTGAPLDFVGGGALALYDAGGMGFQLF